MKKILALAFAAILSGCTKDDNEVIITNLSGTDWYNTQVWYGNSAKDLQGYSDVGYVAIGESCSVETDCSMVYIYAKDSKGRLVMSEPMDATRGKVTITEKDLF